MAADNRATSLFNRWRPGAATPPTSPPAQSHMESFEPGLRIVYEPPAGTATIDIIAIHGFNGHPFGSWTAPNGACWLRDKTFLQQDLPHARVMTYGYDARTFGTSSDVFSQQYLWQLGQSLVQDICSKRKRDGSSERPIIFVAHNLGGIVLKSALIFSDRVTANHLAPLKALRLSTFGILFFGVPHQGGRHNSLGELLAKAARCTNGATNPIVLQHLGEHSEWLQQNASDFLPIISDFEQKSFYEEYAVRIDGQQVHVVPHWSAVLPGQVNTEPIAVHSDHVNMIKFSSRDTGAYQHVVFYLEDMSERAHKRIKENWDKQKRIEAIMSGKELPA